VIVSFGRYVAAGIRRDRPHPDHSMPTAKLLWVIGGSVRMSIAVIRTHRSPKQPITRGRTARGSQRSSA